jgi:hypothetical protein
MRALQLAVHGRAVGLSTVAGIAALALLLSLSSFAASAQPAPTTGQDCPVLQLSNPNPGDLLPNGGYVTSGIAFDPAAPSGTGIARVDFFLGSRDSGGLFLGTTVPGTATDPRAFQLEVKLPNAARGDDFVAYAFSSLTSAFTAVSVPVHVGAIVPTTGRTPTPVSQIATVQTVCAPLAGSTASAGTTTAATPQAMTPAQAPPVSASAIANAAAPVLQLGNPNPGDLLTPGGYVIFGLAFDPSAADGAGVDRVDFFLDSRDSGGPRLATAVPGQNASSPRAFQVEVSISGRLNGAHMLVAYAHSSITGKETVLSVPVFLGIPPTATPRPK